MPASVFSATSRTGRPPFPSALSVTASPALLSQQIFRCVCCVCCVCYVRLVCPFGPTVSSDRPIRSLRPSHAFDPVGTTGGPNRRHFGDDRFCQTVAGLRSRGRNRLGPCAAYGLERGRQGSARRVVCTVIRQSCGLWRFGGCKGGLCTVGRGIGKNFA